MIIKLVHMLGAAALFCIVCWFVVALPVNMLLDCGNPQTPGECVLGFQHIVPDLRR